MTSMNWGISTVMTACLAIKTPFQTYPAAMRHLHPLRPAFDLACEDRTQ
ncbi:MAG: hypothetical protein AW10_00510 [Candidatus Accumulibacter appositus]|uniref:Uncharacterized protein n=1 Tax=Candidatus Accumulibacter appositus TaxID=1454003 RepID=A0A011NHZ8_9PROT|nr:hypothetical protein [Accumulibacter sp.]EXI82403.1 MAG: hypothetical protein AW10_00510 [Candidatus Accumulibacter appositus]